MTESRPPLAPFTLDTAHQKVRAAEDAWNSRNPSVISGAYSLDSKWRHRTQFLQGRAQIEAFLANKWRHENDYRLVKELWDFRENRIAVRFAYEWRDHKDQWYRSYGNENWEFDEHGLMRIRIASINDTPIEKDARKFFWDAPGPRPADHPGLSQFGF